MDYSRIRIFTQKNHLSEDQIDELFNILKDFQDQVIQECYEAILTGVKK